MTLWIYMRWKVALATLLFIYSGIPKAATIVADFGKGAGYPLYKSKINLYTTAIPSTKNFERDIPWLAKLRPEVLRLEFFWGMDQSLSRTVSGTATNPVYDWALIDHWQKLVVDQGSLVQWGYGYTPFSLGDGSKNAFKNPPPSEPWKRIVSDVAAHLKGGPVTYHEVWNEPNFDWFFTGGPTDYFKIYENTSLAIKAVNPDAKVGGPTVSLPDWYQGFVQYVQAKNLPLDFFSYHNYGEMAHEWTSMVNNILVSDPRFLKTETSLDEYNTYHSWPAGGPQDKFEGANEMLFSFLGFLDRPELTSVFWAQFMDPCDCGGIERLGLLDLNGRRKATYNAFRIWAMMPVDRNITQSDAAKVMAVASSDAHHAGLLLLNRTGSDQSITVQFKNVPFSSGQVQIFPIDKTHNSLGDGANEDLTASQTIPNVNLAAWTWTGSIPNMGTLYIDARDGSTESLLQDNPVAKVIHVNHYYPERGKTKAYAEFDRRTWIARLGMNGSAFSDQEVGVTAEGLPSVLEIKLKVEGTLIKKDINSLLGMRLDFQQAGGAYSKGALFHGAYHGGVDLHDPARTAAMPYGTQNPANMSVPVPDLASFSVELAKYAPSDWTGRIQILFIMQNTGETTRAIFQVKGTPSSALQFTQQPKQNPNRWHSLLHVDGMNANGTSGTLEVLNINGKRILRRNHSEHRLAPGMHLIKGLSQP